MLFQFFYVSLQKKITRMVINGCKVDEEGIHIPTSELVELKKHYEGVQRHCATHSSDRLARYYEGKVDILSDILAVIKDGLKSKK